MKHETNIYCKSNKKLDQQKKQSPANDKIHNGKIVFHYLDFHFPYLCAMDNLHLTFSHSIKKSYYIVTMMIIGRLTFCDCALESKLLNIF